MSQCGSIPKSPKSSVSRLHTYTDVDGESETVRVPAAETLADKMYVMALRCTAERCYAPFHKKFREVLLPVTAPSQGIPDGGYHHGPVKGLE